MRKGGKEGIRAREGMVETERKYRRKLVEGKEGREEGGMRR